MKLYHFTSRHHVQDILKEGVSKGVIFSGGTIENPEFTYGYQWLTTNPNPSQSWNEGSSLPYNRCEYRLELEITRIGDILNWLDVCKHLTIHSEMLNSYGDPENWRLFRGTVYPSWIKKKMKMKVVKI